MFLPLSSLLRTDTLNFVQFIVGFFFNELGTLSLFPPVFFAVLQTGGCSSCFLQHISHAGDANKIGESQDCPWLCSRTCPTVVRMLPGGEVRFRCKISHVLTKLETKVSYPQWCFGRGWIPAAGSCTCGLEQLSKGQCILQCVCHPLQSAFPAGL